MEAAESSDFHSDGEMEPMDIFQPTHSTNADSNDEDVMRELWDYDESSEEDVTNVSLLSTVSQQNNYLKWKHSMC